MFLRALIPIFRHSTRSLNNVCLHNNRALSILTSTNCIGPNSAVLTQPRPKVHDLQKRFRKKSKSTNKQEEEDESDESDESDDEITEENPLLSDGASGKDTNRLSKLCATDIPSLRLDVVAKVGFNTTRAKVEEAFYNGKIFINGERARSKSVGISLGDELDLVKGPNSEDPDMMDIARAVITKLPDKATQQGRLKVEIERFPNLTIKPYGSKDD